jgi:hypothetical protein
VSLTSSRVIDIVAGPTALAALRRTEPDIHLIKQVEQDKTGGTGGLAGLRTAGPGISPGFPSVGIIPIRQLLSWLLSGCKNSEDSLGSEGSRDR